MALKEKKTPKKPLRQEEKFERINSDNILANCKPLGDRIVVQRDVAKKQTEGGILLPESASRSKMPTGVIVRIGPGKMTDDGRVVPMPVKLGDRVILSDYAGLEIRDPMTAKNSEDEFVILRAEDILAVVP